jgi:uncharacterized protein
VLIGNTFWLYSARGFDPPHDKGRLDELSGWLVDLLVQSKAQTLLTFLFGFGFAVQLLRAEARHEPVMALYVRRLFVLLAIGTLHVMLWWGDVTWTYAVAGFGLLLFQRTSNRRRLIWAAILIFVPTLLNQLPSVRKATADLIATQAEAHRVRDVFLSTLHGKRFLPNVRQHLRWAMVFQAPFYVSYYFWLIGRFLIGYVAGKQRWFDNEGAGHLPLFRKLIIYGAIADIPTIVVTALFGFHVLEPRKLSVAAHLVVTFVHELGLLGLTAAYIGIVVMLMQRQAWRHVLALIAPAGRMPLTTYILQSVICTFLFYGWGLGWAGKVGGAGCVLVACTVFSFEVLVCHLWLRRFRFGPLEWVWRTLVYLEPPPLRA